MTLTFDKEQLNKLILREDGTKKKVILSNLGIASLLKEGEDLLDKLKRNMEVYAENRNDVFVIFAVQTGMREKLELVKKDILESFDNVLNQYEQADFCMVIDYEDMDEIYDMCDAYYGDWSIGAWRCRLMEKPVMIQNAHVE